MVFYSHYFKNLKYKQQAQLQRQLSLLPNLKNTLRIKKMNSLDNHLNEELFAF